MNDGVPELVYEDFVRARDLHNHQNGPMSESGRPSSNVGKGEGDSGCFLFYSPGPGDLFAVFEQNGHDGRFYVYDGAKKHVLRSVHVYDRAAVAVAEDEIDIGWAADDSVCGLAVFGRFYAFLGVKSDLELRKPLTMDSHGFAQEEWPVGFEHYRENQPE